MADVAVGFVGTILHTIGINISLYNIHTTNLNTSQENLHQYIMTKLYAFSSSHKFIASGYLHYV